MFPLEIIALILSYSDIRLVLVCRRLSKTIRHIIKSKFIKETPVNPWNWDGISENPNITWEIIKANPDKEWYWWELSWNKFTKPFNLDTI